MMVGPKREIQERLSRPEIEAALRYERETGRFFWKERSLPKNWNNQYAGKEAGTTLIGYCKITLHGNHIMAHRLVWFLETGRWPEKEIDHIDGDRKNNRIENLREVTSAENRRNLGLNKRNTSGHAGVSHCKDRNKWSAMIYDRGKPKFLGRFDSKEGAVAARKAAERELGYHRNHCKSDRPSYS